MDNLIAPGELISINPKMKGKWTANDIGQLLRMGLVSGYKLSRGCLVSEEDVKKLFETRKKK